MLRLRELWSDLRASLWFIPMILFIGSIILALGMIQIDLSVGTEALIELSPVFAISAEGARTMLLAVAGSMLTVVALSFGLSLTAMTFASGQFTPRILRNFMRDRANQFILGYFVGIFAYSMITLLAIRSSGVVQFIPVIAVFVGLLFGLGGVIVLIFFIHHISSSLQITKILNNIVDDTKKSIQTIFPKNVADPAEQNEKLQAWQADKNQQWLTVPSASSGYVQNVDTARLIKYAEDNDVILRMECGIGKFIPRGAALISITRDNYNDAGKSGLDEEIINTLNANYGIERHRTIERDVSYGIRQIVDIALKALSIGVNDTSTGVNCVHFLSDILGEIARKKFTPKVRSIDGRPRLITEAPDFRDYVETAFDQIRISGKGNMAILEQLAEAISFISICTRDKSRLQILKQQLALTAELANQTLETEYEKAQFQEKHEKAQAVL